jgi:hypothetical protein
MPYANPEDAKAYREKNKEKLKAYHKAWNKAYYEKNKEKINARHKAYREKNKEQIKAYHKAHSKAYYEKNKEKINAKSKAYREKNKEKLRAKSKAYREKNREKIRAKDIKRKFGIGLHEYNLMFTEQKGKCACCGIHQNKLTNRFAVDHDHDTGLIRGLLCNHCNLAIGKLGDNIEGVMKALNYLEKHELTKERKTNEHVVQVKPKPNVQVKVQRGHLQSQVPA